MKYLYTLALALAATLMMSAPVSANSERAMILPPGQGRSTRGIRSVITGQKIRSHTHHSRRRGHDGLLDRNLTNATAEARGLDVDEDELEAIAYSKRTEKSCATKAGKKQHKSYRAWDNNSSSSSKSSSSDDGESSSSSPTSSSSSSSSSRWKLVKSYAGSNFFNDMFFFTGNDPTNGMIDYVDQGTAQSNGLIGTKNGKAFMKMQNGASGAAKSIRISTKDTFTTGIFILDAEHMPVGCGVWPSWWSTPQSPAGGWPNGGEIDMIEGVNDQSINTYSIHSSSGCSVQRSVLDMIGELKLAGNQGTNCASYETNNEGCGVKSKTWGDFGVGYNNGGGGVHAMYWDSDEGIKSFFFKKGDVPDDISSGSPDPSNWGTPQAEWPATNCNMDQFFFNHVVVFTNTLCGDWAGSGAVWSNKMSGQEQSCSASTGKGSCYDYINGNPDLSEAYWSINSLKIYQTKRRQ